MLTLDDYGIDFNLNLSFDLTVIKFVNHMTMEMSVGSMKSNSVSGIMAEYPDIVTYRRTSLEKISPQLSFCSIKLYLFHSIFLLIAVVKSPFCHFFSKIA